MANQRLITSKEFFTKKNDCPMIIQEFYDLNNLEFELFCSLEFLGSASVKQLMEHVGRSERSLVNRALNNLVDRGLCTRSKDSQKGKRGYFLQYKPIPLEELKENLKKILQTWSKNTLSEIENIRNRFESMHS